MKRALTGAADAAAASLEVAGSRRPMLVISAAAASIMTGVPVFAASPAAPSDDTSNVSEVVVTANKLNSTVVLETPASIQAISGQDLQKQGVAGFMDIAAQI